MAIGNCSIGNSSVGQPFSSTDAVAMPTHSNIHFLQRVGKFILAITESRYLKSTESYAFSKSTLNKSNSLFNRLASSTASFAIKIPSKIYFPLIKADWDSETTLPITNRSLLARNLFKTLYRHPTKEIGRQSLSRCGLFTLGIK
jgi:hypothetical protein